MKRMRRTREDEANEEEENKLLECFLFGVGIGFVHIIDNGLSTHRFN
jgi:hypothetical protein